MGEVVMVKKAEEKKVRSPLLPVFGLIMAVSLFSVAFLFASGPVPDNPPVQGMFQQMDRADIPKAIIGLAVGIWVIFLAAAVFLVAMLVGRDPEDAKQLPLPPRSADLKKIHKKK